MNVASVRTARRTLRLQNGEVVKLNIEAASPDEPPQQCPCHHVRLSSFRNPHHNTRRILPVPPRLGAHAHPAITLPDMADVAPRHHVRVIRPLRVVSSQHQTRQLPLLNKTLSKRAGSVFFWIAATRNGSYTTTILITSINPWRGECVSLK